MIDNNIFLKAWEEVKANHSRSMFKTMDTEYWIESGVKIEMDVLGTVHVHVCLNPGDKFSTPSLHESLVFEESGWESGINIVNVNFFDKLVRLCEARSRRAKTDKDRMKADNKVREYKAKSRDFKIKYEISLDKR